MASRPAMKVPSTNTPVYTGGEADAYTWTQTDADIELRLPVPPHVKGSHVRAEFTPRQLSVWVDGRAMAEGVLDAPVTSDECCWVLEEEVLVVSLPKAKHQRWNRLFRAEKVQPVRRIDGGAVSEKHQAVQQEQEQALMRSLFSAAQADEVDQFRLGLSSNLENSPHGEQAEAKLFENFMDAHAVNLLHAAAISGSTAVAQLICSR